MGHQHHHHHSSNNIRLAFFLNLGFTLFEIAGGLWTNSTAILSDALHDLGDSVSLGMAWFLESYSKKESNQKFSYGYGRFSLLGALLNAVILITGSIFILSEAVPRVLNPEETNAPGMIAFALVGVAVNGAAAFRLRGENSLNARMVAWHLLEDVLGWVSILVAGLVLLFIDLPIIDPILAILLTLYILFNIIRNLRQTLNLFLQATPGEIDLNRLEQDFVKIAGVKSCHHTHVWSLDGDHHVLSSHLVVDEDATKHDLVRIKQACKDIIGDIHLTHVTLELEYEDEDCTLRELAKDEADEAESTSH